MTRRQNPKNTQHKNISECFKEQISTQDQLTVTHKNINFHNKTNRRISDKHQHLKYKNNIRDLTKKFQGQVTEFKI